jgi:hypothetical protein
MKINIKDPITDKSVLAMLNTATGQGISTISRANFPLPTLGARVIALGRSLYHGCGFFVLRGLDPTRYTAEDNVILYVGVSSWVAEKRGRQDEHNSMLCGFSLYRF